MDRTILLVEDDASLATVLQRILSRLDATVEHTGSGREALSRIDEGGVDLVVLDLDLPDLDGVEVCRTARTSGYPGSVLVLTARHGLEHRTAALGSGADDYLTKPFGISELVTRLRALLDADAEVSGTRAV